MFDYSNNIICYCCASRVLASRAPSSRDGSRGRRLGGVSVCVCVHPMRPTRGREILRTQSSRVDCVCARVCVCVLSVVHYDCYYYDVYYCSYIRLQSTVYAYVRVCMCVVVIVINIVSDDARYAHLCNTHCLSKERSAAHLPTSQPTQHS